MSLPYHRGRNDPSMYRPGSGPNGGAVGTKDQRINEVNQNLLEQENDRHWVRFLRQGPQLGFIFSYSIG